MKLKRFGFTTLLWCFSSFFLEAQMINTYGLKISVVRSSFNITDKTPVIVGSHTYYIDYVDGPSIHPSIGVFVQNTTIQNLSIEAELLYIQKGASKTYELLVATAEDPDGFTKKETVTNKIDLDYLQFGINLQPKLQFGGFDIYASIGPSINYLLSPGPLVSEDSKNIVLGYNLGIGITLENIVNAPIFVEAKYNGDLSSFYSSRGKYWNRIILMNLGVNL
jgi:hypothetical protein